MKKSPVSAIAVIAAVIVATFAPGVAHAQASCPAGTVAYWPLDGDAVDSVNSIAGVEVGNVTYTPGKVGQAADLDGDLSYIQAALNAPWSGFGGTAMSLTMWLKPQEDPQISDPTSGQDGSGHFFNDPDSAVITARTQCDLGSFQLYSNLGSNVYFSKWLPNPESHSPSETSIFANQGLPNDEWSHLAVTFAGAFTSFYVNGVLVDQVAFTDLPFDINNATKDVQLGWDSCSSYYTGELDEVAVYDRALSATEVGDQFAKGLAGIPLCTADADGDGVPDDQDVCPGTSGDTLADGCDCDQILDFKPGKGGQCNAGTLNVFTNRVGWAKKVPLAGSGQ